MDKLKALFKLASKQYASSVPHYETCLALVYYCQEKLNSEAAFAHYGDYAGTPRVPYSVFSLREDCLSRPIRAELYILDKATYQQEHDHLTTILRKKDHAWQETDYLQANRVVYTAVMSLACCFDLWQRSSRKTPGTFFEFFFAGLLQTVMPDAVFSKHISLVSIVDDPEVKADATVEELAVATEEIATDDDSDETIESQSGPASVSTDLVIGKKDQSGGVVVPLKITTRERIVQPFAHQRILDSAFGEGRYRSMIVCISETQLDQKTKSVKQVCVPGTIELFQRYLAPVAGIYYCDLPQRYGSASMEKIVRVSTIGHFFDDLVALLSEITSQDKAGSSPSASPREPETV